MGNPFPNLPDEPVVPLPGDDPLWRHALRVFEGASRAGRWFRTQHAELGMSPVEAVETPEGRQRVDAILTNIEYGLPV